MLIRISGRALLKTGRKEKGEYMILIIGWKIALAFTACLTNHLILVTGPDPLRSKSTKLD